MMMRSSKATPEYHSKYSRRGGLISLLFGLFALLIIFRLFYIQVLNAEFYRELAADQTTNREIVPAERGRIYDRNGRLLATNVVSYDIGARLMDIRKPDLTFRILEEHFARSAAEYRAMFPDSTTFVYLERRVPLEIGLTLQEYKEGIRTFDSGEKKIRRRDAKPVKLLAGIRLEKKSSRSYPFNEAAGQVLGFTGKDQFGLSGVEKSFDELLSGRSGYREVLIDKYGRPMLSGGSMDVEPEHGKDLALSIDIDYQIILEEEIRKAVEKTGARDGMGIIMNPNTGEILAMASLPDFNPNHYLTEKVEHQKIRPITDTYEPGSVFKIMALTAALDLQRFSTESLINCENGKWRIFDRTLHDDHPSEWSSVRDIIVHSSNIGTAKIAEQLGNEIMYRTIRRYGIGDIKSLELPGLTQGLIRSPEDWERISNSQISIGQNVTTTLVELSTAYSAIANGGNLLQPTVYYSDRERDNEDFSPRKPVLVRRVMKESTADTLRSLLEQVVEEGTGKYARIPGYRIAGKTGTAQKVVDGKYSQRDYYSTFVSFFPANRPVLLCAVAIDDARYGMHTAALSATPAVKNVFSRIINSTDFRKLYDWVGPDSDLLAETQDAQESQARLNSDSAADDASLYRRKISFNLFNLGRSPSEDQTPESSSPESNESTVEKTDKSTENSADHDTREFSDKSFEPESVYVPVRMPDLIGMNLSYADHILRELNISVTVHGEGGKVVHQVPEPGISVSIDMVSELYVTR